MNSPPFPPVFKITVIRERPPVAFVPPQESRSPDLDEEDAEDAEDPDDEADAESLVSQKASGCAPTGLGCLVLLGPLVVWALT